MTHDGLGKYLSQIIEKAPGPTADVVGILKERKVDVMVSYLPVGSEEATKWYVEQALKAGVGFINAIPVFIGREPYWQRRFAEEGLPVIGDDIKSQVGATISHRVLTRLFMDRGVRLDRTYQLNFGGNTDFLNMLERERLESRRRSARPTPSPRCSTTRWTPTTSTSARATTCRGSQDRKWCYIRMEGTTFGDVPLNAELKLEVWDSPNSAGVITDAIRCLKLGLDRGLKGTLVGPSSYFMKSPAGPDPRRHRPPARRGVHPRRGQRDARRHGEPVQAGPQEAASTAPSKAKARAAAACSVTAKERGLEAPHRRAARGKPRPMARRDSRSPRVRQVPARLLGRTRESRGPRLRRDDVGRRPRPGAPLALGDRDRIAGRLPVVADEAATGRTRTSATSSGFRLTTRASAAWPCGAYREYARYLVEVMHLESQSVEEAGSKVVQADLDHIEESWRGSKGGLIFTLGHVGNNEAVAAAVAGRGWPVNVVADDSSFPEMFERFRRLREAWGVHVIPWRNLREIYAVLRRREMLALLIDWGYRPDGIPVRLFGAWTTLPAGPATLAAKTGSRILPVSIRRTPDGLFHVSYAPVIEVASAAPADLQRATQAVADALAGTVAAAPRAVVQLQADVASDAPRRPPSSSARGGDARRRSAAWRTCPRRRSD